MVPLQIIWGVTFCSRIVNAQYYINFWCIAQCLSIFTYYTPLKLLQNSHYNSQCYILFAYLKIKTQQSLSLNPIPLVCPSPLITTSLFSISESVSLLHTHFLYYFLVSTYKRYHRALVFLCLTYLTKQNSLQVHPHCYKWQNYIVLWLSNISSHTYTQAYIPHLLYPFVCDEHLSDFNILAIVNSASMNTGVHASFQISVSIFSRYIPRNGIDGSHGSSIFSF